MTPDSSSNGSSGIASIDPLLGVIVAGRYRIISRLGQGGMGVTYRAWDLETGRPVVLKHPQSEFFAKPGFLERFGREARMMASLSHPNVVHVTTVGEHDGIPYLVMPFLPGGSLANRRLRDDSGQPKPMHPSTLHLWLPQVAEALDYVHSQGVVHRDVKPGNVFFDAFWHASLGDFGISKIVEETSTLEKEHTLTATSIAVGTQEYMAPEMFSPKPKIDGRIDQYALAVMAYETLAGRRPFTGDTAHVIVEITTRNVPPLAGFRRDLPPSLEQAVATGLAKHTGDRFPTCRDLARSILADVPPMQDEPDVARLLCPQCENMLKLPTAAAGRKGRCPRCSNQMMVADDLGALWLTNEEAGGTNSKASRASTASTDSPPQEPRRKLPRGSDSWQVPTPTPTSGETPARHWLGRVWSQTGSAVWLTAIAAIAFAFLFADAVLVDDRNASHHTKTLATLQQTIATLQAELAQAKTNAGAFKEDGRTLSRENEQLVSANESLQQQNQELVAKLALAERRQKAADPERTLEPGPQPPDPISPPSDSTTEMLRNSIGVTLRLCRPGSFIMGSNNDRANADEKPTHEVRITRPFYIGMHEVTNAQWKQMMGSVPSQWKDDDLPVETVNWEAAVDFCRRISELPEERRAGRVYRLPTEAEWEYACRAGTSTSFAFGEAESQLQEFGWFVDNSGGKTHPVGQKKPNVWGIFDMHGNVWECCSDWYGNYPSGVVTNPTALSSGLGRVLRGGGWGSSAGSCRSACRNWFDPSFRSNLLGLRLALSVSTFDTPQEKK